MRIRTRSIRKEPIKVGGVSRAGRTRISRKKARETAAGSRAVVADFTREKTRIRTEITAISGGRKERAMTMTAGRRNDDPRGIRRRRIDHAANAGRRTTIARKSK